MLAETQTPYTEWLSLVPRVQATMNQIPSDRLGGLTPAQAMLGRDTPRPLDTVCGEYLRKDEDTQPPDSLAIRQRYLDAAEAIQSSWLLIQSAAERRHAANQRARTRTQKAVDFAIGDFVLAYASVNRNKLRVKWLGPYRVTDTINDRVFEVESLLDGKKSVMHAQRLRMYADAALNVTEDLRSQVAYDDRLYVTGFANFREMDDDTLQLLTTWLGFERSEATWESVEAMHKDVPTMVVKYLRTIEPESSLVHPLLKAWDKDYVSPPTAKPQRKRCRPQSQ